MNEDEQFISDLNYFWFEKGHTGFSNFSVERLREIDPTLADAYERMTSAQDTFNRLLKRANDE